MSKLNSSYLKELAERKRKSKPKFQVGAEKTDQTSTEEVYPMDVSKAVKNLMWHNPDFISPEKGSIDSKIYSAENFKSLWESFPKYNQGYESVYDVDQNNMGIQQGPLTSQRSQELKNLGSEEQLKSKYFGKPFGGLPFVEGDYHYMGYAPNRIWVNRNQPYLPQNTQKEQTQNEYIYFLTPRTNPDYFGKYVTFATLPENSKFEEEVINSLKGTDWDERSSDWRIPIYGDIWGLTPKEVKERIEKIKSNPEIVKYAQEKGIDLDKLGVPGYGTEESKKDLKDASIWNWGSFLESLKYGPEVEKYKNLALVHPRTSVESFVIQNPSEFNLSGYLPVTEDMYGYTKTPLRRYDYYPTHSSEYNFTVDKDEPVRELKRWDKGTREKYLKQAGVPENLWDSVYIHTSRFPIQEYQPGKEKVIPSKGLKTVDYMKEAETTAANMPKTVNIPARVNPKDIKSSRRKNKKGYEEGGLSTEGYKRNSPDVNNPYNIIPSNQITMEDVDFPVLGIDDIGNQIMMQPGQDYTFPGNYVTEFPMKNMGNKRFGQVGFQKNLTPFGDYLQKAFYPEGVTTEEEYQKWLNAKPIEEVKITAKASPYKYNPAKKSPLAKNYQTQDNLTTEIYKKSDIDLSQTQEADKERKRQEELKKFGESVFGVKPSPITQAVDAAAVVGDVVTDVMQVGNFIPHPYAQVIGKAGNWLGAGIDAYQAGRNLYEEDYGNAAMNIGSAALPYYLSKQGYLRPMSAINNYRGKYRPLNYLPGTTANQRAAMSPYINANRRVAGSLIGETAYDAGLINDNNYNTIPTSPRDNTSLNQVIIQPLKNRQPVFKQAQKLMGGELGAKFQTGGTKSVVLEPDYDMYKAPKQGNYLLPDINRPYYTDETGDKRSEYRMGKNIDGRETLIPTVVGGRQLTEDEALQRYYQTGLHMGMYNTPEQAEYASRLRTAKYNMLQDPVRFNASMFKNGGVIRQSKSQVKQTLKYSKQKPNKI